MAPLLVQHSVIYGYAAPVPLHPAAGARRATSSFRGRSTAPHAPGSDVSNPPDRIGIVCSTSGIKSQPHRIHDGKLAFRQPDSKRIL